MGGNFLLKRILIISEFFAPQNAIAAVRSTKIAKYLKRQGNYEILVATKVFADELEDRTLKKDMKYVDKLYCISPGKYVCLLNQMIDKAIRSSVYDKQIRQSKSFDAVEKQTFKQKFYHSARYLRQIINDKSYIRQAWKMLKNTEFDVVISTFGPFSSHLLGYKIKKAYPHIRWIADFRDPVITDYAPIFFQRFLQQFEQETMEHADVITAVSSGLLDMLPLEKGKSAFVIPNGFDREDLDAVPFPVPEENFTASEDNQTRMKLTFLYTGQMYAGRSDLSLFYKALRELIAENRLSLGSIQIIYAGFSFAEFYRQAELFGLQDQLINQGYVSRERSLHMQKEAHVLLLASWNRTGSTGIITGKFLEYMLMDKPIVCIMTGDLPDSQLKQMITSAQNGICCEEAGGAIDFGRLKQYLLSLYNGYQENGQICFLPNKAYIETYDYQNIVRELEKLL
jgi:hypothetical protein